MTDGERSWTRADLPDPAYEALARGLSGSRLWSLLLDVMEQRASARTTSDLLAQWQRDGFTRPAYADQRALNEIDGELLAAASSFEALELSPLAPLGTCSVMGLASQNKVVSALRGTEVVSDPTNVFALEAAQRLKKDPFALVRLATCHRCVRAQEVPKQPGFAQHFRIFCLGTAGRESENHRVVVDALLDHVQTHLAALDRLEQRGYSFGARNVRVLASAERAAVADRVAERIANIPVSRDLLEHRYYGGLRFLIHVHSPAGQEVPLIDGGSFDWVARLASNARFVYVASGMGAQLVAYMFRTRAG